MTVSEWLSAGTLVVVLGFIASMLTIKPQNRKINAEARHLDTDNITVFTDAAKTMLEPLTTQLAAAQADCAVLRQQAKELTAEIEHQRAVIAETTAKLELANRRATYWKTEFEARADNR